MAQHTIAIIGVGKIAQDQHLPVIARNPDFRLTALVSQRGVVQPGVPTFAAPETLFAAMPELDAVAICTPPNARYAYARMALDAGKHVLLEKPPVPTTAELSALAAHADARKRVIFTTWHSQYNAAVAGTRRFLTGKRLKRLAITWKEDVRRWHPGQDWIWQQGGFGVFDPGINALSILTEIMPQPIFVREATLVYPANRDMPIAAELTFHSNASTDLVGRTLTADFDWRQDGEQTWDFAGETEDGSVFALTLGGSKLTIDGQITVEAPSEEYEAIYRRFADLLRSGESLVDSNPFQLVADAFMVGRRIVTDPFFD